MFACSEFFIILNFFFLCESLKKKAVRALWIKKKKKRLDTNLVNQPSLLDSNIELLFVP